MDNATKLMKYARLLERLGFSGEVVWRVAKTIEDEDERLEYLRRACSFMRNKTRNKVGVYHSPPVDIDTFIVSKLMLDMGDEVYPLVREDLRKICSGKYVECVLTGGIGVGKTTLALIITAYTLYELSCMINPQAEFGLTKSSEIVFIFQSLKKETAIEVDYKRFKAMLDASPYFASNFPYNRDLSSQMEFPHRVVVKPLSGDTAAAIGQNVFGGIIDEINFMAVTEGSKMSADGGTFDQAKEIYNSIARRRQSRFMKQGDLPGMLCLVSSKRYPGEFTDRKAAEARNPKNRIYVFDKRVWDVKDHAMFSGEWFTVFVGDDTRRPRILSENDVLPEETDEDFPLYDRIPGEYRAAFEEDLLAALRDVAGVSTMALHPYILEPGVAKDCFGSVNSILTRTDVDFDRTQLGILPDAFQFPDEPRFVHIDLAISGDSAGVACAFCPGFETVQRGDQTEVLPIIQYDFTLEVRPPRGGEINFDKIRQLLYKLIELGLNIKWVTLDSFQSKDMMQILASRGIMAGLQSMDVTSVPYDVMKRAMYDERLYSPDHPHAADEIVRLERDPKTKKIDHPPNGSKDVSDAMAGACYGISLRREIWSRHGVSPSHMPQHVTAGEGRGKSSISGQEVRLAA